MAAVRASTAKLMASSIAAGDSERFTTTKTLMVPKIPDTGGSPTVRRLDNPTVVTTCAVVSRFPVECAGVDETTGGQHTDGMLEPDSSVVLR